MTNQCAQQGFRLRTVVNDQFPPTRIMPGLDSASPVASPVPDLQRHTLAIQHLAQPPQSVGQAAGLRDAFVKTRKQVGVDCRRPLHRHFLILACETGPVGRRTAKRYGKPKGRASCTAGQNTPGNHRQRACDVLVDVLRLASLVA